MTMRASAAWVCDDGSGLQRLLGDVVSGNAEFSAILFYDVSRWGRFQNTDESAHYEFLCKSAGVDVIYTAEPFANDGSLASSLVKHLKRAKSARSCGRASERRCDGIEPSWRRGRRKRWLAFGGSSGCSPAKGSPRGALPGG